MKVFCHLKRIVMDDLKDSHPQGDNTGEGGSWVTLVVAGQNITCSRNKLSENSDYFKAMFNSNMKESKSEVISLEQVDPEAMKTIINFMETGHLTITQDNVETVTEAACMYQVKNVIDICCQTMDHMLNDDNCLAIMTLADTFSLDKLYNRSRRHCIWYFTDLINTDSFVNSDVQVVCDLLSDRQLNVKSELDIYHAIHRWISHDSVSREKHLPKLISLIHIEDLTDKEISFLNDQILIQGREHIFRNVKTSPRHEHYRNISRVLMTIGGVDNIDVFGATEDSPPATPQMYQFDDNTMTFSTIPMTDSDLGHPATKDDMGYSVCVHGKNLYISGGLNPIRPGRNTWWEDMWCLDTFTGHWEPVTKLLSPRRHHTTVGLGDSLYLLGGFGKYRIKLNTCEEFNTKTGDWKELPPMPEESFLLAACSCSSNRIYAFKSSAFYYDIGSSHWTKVDSHVYNITSIVPANALQYRDCVYITSRYNKDLHCFNTENQTLIKVGEFQHAESISTTELHNNRVCRYSSGNDSLIVMEWYDIIKKEFGSLNVSGTCIPAVQNFHLLSIPQISDFR